jgi:hydroxyacylglutathione hydrolase
VVPVLSGVGGCDATGYPVPAVALESIEVVDDGDSVSVGAFTASVIATPGHTPGDLTYEIAGNLFCGDLLFYRSVGRTDFPGGDFPTLLASVAKLAENYPAATPIHPGHMQSTTMGEELTRNPFLQGLDIDA